MCVSALLEPGRKHIPFRNSCLTRLLQDCLSGLGRIILVATIRDGISYAEETLSTLQFAARAARIQSVLISLQDKRKRTRISTQALRRVVTDLRLQIAISEAQKKEILTTVNNPNCQLCDSMKIEFDSMKTEITKLINENKILKEQISLKETNKMNFKPSNKIELNTKDIYEDNINILSSYGMKGIDISPVNTPTNMNRYIPIKSDNFEFISNSSNKSYIKNETSIINSSNYSNVLQQSISLNSNNNSNNDNINDSINLSDMDIIPTPSPAITLFSPKHINKPLQPILMQSLSPSNIPYLPSVNSNNNLFNTSNSNLINNSNTNNILTSNNNNNLMPNISPITYTNRDNSNNILLEELKLSNNSTRNSFMNKNDNNIQDILCTKHGLSSCVLCHMFTTLQTNSNTNINKLNQYTTNTNTNILSQSIQKKKDTFYENNSYIRDSKNEIIDHTYKLPIQQLQIQYNNNNQNKCNVHNLIDCLLCQLRKIDNNTNTSKSSIGTLNNRSDINNLPPVLIHHNRASSFTFTNNSSYPLSEVDVRTSMSSGAGTLASTTPMYR